MARITRDGTLVGPGNIRSCEFSNSQIPDALLRTEEGKMLENSLQTQLVPLGQGGVMQGPLAYPMPVWLG
jgi:hypothetical protein